MALDNKDEDYLEQLLNSVVEGSEADSDDWFEKELEDGDFNFDEEISDINDDLELSSEDEQQELTGEDAEEPFNGDLSAEEVLAEPSALEDSFAAEPFMEESFMDKNFTEEFSTEESQKDEIPAEETDQIDVSEEVDTAESDDDLADILSMINAIEQEEEESDSEPEDNGSLEEDNRAVKRYEDIHMDESSGEEPEPAQEKVEPKKSKGFFGKLFSRSKKSEQAEDNSLIDVDSILDETGSVMDDIDSLGLSDFGFGGDLNIDSASTGAAEDAAEEAEDKKAKKEKKKKEKKEKKPKKVKEPKEKKKKPVKPPVIEEKIRFTPLGLVLSLSVIVASVCLIYFGAGFFSYNRNIDKATGYYVDKNYTKAYAILSGMDLKDSDKAFYQQVVTIMKVEKHYNEFNTYYKLEMNVDALDSLIRGIKTYDSVIDKARELGTFDQTTSSLGKIIDCLSSYYGMTESEARQLSQMADREEYSRIINSKVSEKGTYR